MSNKQAKTKKIYMVRLETTQPITQGEDFFMYRIFETKTTAINFAKTLSTFFPYYKYPTTVLVEESTLTNDDVMKDPKTIYSSELKNEQGKIV